MNKQLLLGMLKSKTINTNVALTILVTWLAASNGIPLPPEVAPAVVALVYGGANVILRFFTNKSLPDKGVNIPNPLYVEEVTKALTKNSGAIKEIVKSVSQDDEALKELHSALAGWIKKQKTR